jgi:hypothetical protein
MAPVVAPLLVNPPHRRTSEPKTSATARLRPAGSRTEDRAMTIRGIAGGLARSEVVGLGAEATWVRAGEGRPAPVEAVAGGDG